MKRFSFNLKWVFVSIAVPCVLLAVSTHAWRQQTNAKRILNRNRAIITFRNPGGKWTGVERNPKSGLHILRGDFPKVVGFIQREDRRLSDYEISQLLELPMLERIDLSGMKLKRQIIRSLVEQEHIYELYLGDTDLSDDQLFELVADGHVDFIEISGTKVTESGIAKIVRDFPSFGEVLEIKSPVGIRMLRKIHGSESP